MGDVVPIKPNQTLEKECEHCVEVLEGLLEQAKHGKIRTLAIAYTRPSGSIGTHWTQGDVIPLWASVSLLFNRIMDDEAAE